MKTKLFFSILLFFFGVIFTFAQNYPNIVNYNFNGTPSYGIKIKTNLPFVNSSQMPTVKIEGYNYSSDPSYGATINLNIAWYIYGDAFYASTASSFGGTAPDVWLSNENGKVVIFLDQKIYYQRFTISAFAKGISEKPEYFAGWTVVDAALSGTQKKQVPYKNIFAGNVGIGTENPQAKLDVRGTISATEVKVQVLTGADHVFNQEGNLRSLSEVESFIKEHKHLPEIQSEKQMQEEGINMNEFQIKLLQKIEELTLYVIQQEKRLQKQENNNSEQKEIIERLNQENKQIREQLINK